jgi:serine/threonine protein kinase
MTSDFGYQLLTKVGEGPDGTAWRARARASGMHALVRVFHGSQWDDESARGIFRARAELLGRVEHPHLARQLQAGCLPDGRPYVVSEYLDGEDLATYLRRSGPLTPEELSLLVLPLCSVLMELRGRGIVVGALPLEQIFLVGGLSRFSPKLIGPGLSDAVDEPEAGADVVALGRLMREAGTPSLGWLEPVIAGCEPIDGAPSFSTPADVAGALLEAQPRTELLPTKEGGEPPPLLLVEEADREKVGDVLGQYRLERLLGEGAMGRVFEARHISLGRPAAVKVLRAEHAKNTHLIERFFHEARAVNQINHAHIVEILDFVEETEAERPRVYCVMEMLEGRSLTELLARERPSLARAMGMVRQVCSALQAAHDVGVIHRDVKPDNLFLLERDGRDFVKVLDFGVAKLVNPLGEVPLTTTVEGTIVGTPAYMAPEQATGGQADARTDLYAVGVVLYELLAGHPPFQAPAFGQLVAQVLSSPPPPLPTYTPGGERIPPSLAAVVRHCLAKDPADRFASMQELSQAIDIAEQRAAQGSRIRPWMLAAGVGALAVCLAAAGGLWHRHAAVLPVASVVPPTAVVLPVAPLSPPGPLPLPSADVGLTVESTPSGARVVEVDSGRVLGTTPLSIRLPRSSEVVRLRLERARHRSAEVSVVPNADRQLTVALSKRRAQSGVTVVSGPNRPDRRTAKHADPFKL